MIETSTPEFRELQQALTAGRLLAFVGAGISKAANYPTWDELMERLADEAGERFRRSDGDYAFMAHRLRMKLGQARYERFMQEEFGPKRMRLKQVHKDLVSLPFRHFLTTNYDSVLDTARQEVFPDAPTEVLRWHDQGISEFLGKVADVGTSPRFVHIHGRYDVPRSIVLTEMDYTERYISDAQAMMQLFSIFSTNPVLFLGFSLRDVDLMQVFRHVQVYARHTEHYAVLALEADQNADPVREYLTMRFGIRPIFYRKDDSHSQLHSLIERLLGATNGAPLTVTRQLGGQGSGATDLSNHVADAFYVLFSQDRGAIVLAGISDSGKSLVARLVFEAINRRRADGAPVRRCCWVSSYEARLHTSPRLDERKKRKELKAYNSPIISALATALSIPAVNNRPRLNEVIDGILEELARTPTLIVLDGLEYPRDERDLRQLNSSLPKGTFIIETIRCAERLAQKPFAKDGYVRIIDIGEPAAGQQSWSATRSDVLRRIQSQEWWEEAPPGAATPGAYFDHAYSLWIEWWIAKLRTHEKHARRVDDPVVNSCLRRWAEIAGNILALLALSPKSLPLPFIHDVFSSYLFEPGEHMECRRAERVERTLEELHKAAFVQDAPLLIDAEEAVEAQPKTPEHERLYGVADVVREWVQRSERHELARARVLRRLVEWIQQQLLENPNWQEDGAHRKRMVEHLPIMRAVVDGCLSSNAIPFGAYAEAAVLVGHMLHMEGCWAVAEDLLRRIVEHPQSAKAPFAETMAHLLLARHLAHLRLVDDACRHAKKADELIQTACVNPDDRWMLDDARDQAALRQGHAMHKVERLRAEARAFLTRCTGSEVSPLTRSAAYGYLAQINLDEAADMRSERNIAAERQLLLHTLCYIGKARKDLEGIHESRTSGHHARLVGDAHRQLSTMREGVTAEAAMRHRMEARRCYARAERLSSQWADERLGARARLGLAWCDHEIDFVYKATRWPNAEDRDVAQETLEQLLEQTSDSLPAKRPPLIFLLGPPASGKTALRGSVKRQMWSWGYKIAELGIEEAHRAVYSGVDREQQMADYIDDFRQRVIFKNDQRAALIETGFDQLMKWVEEAQQKEGAVVEIAHHDLDTILGKIGPKLCGSLVVLLSAAQDQRARRNRDRGVGAVPESYVRNCPDTFPKADFEKKGAVAVTLSADEPLEDVRNTLIRELHLTYAPMVW